jgi:hypothetical protein
MWRTVRGLQLISRNDIILSFEMCRHCDNLLFLRAVDVLIVLMRVVCELKRTTSLKQPATMGSLSRAVGLGKVRADRDKIR